MDRVTAAVIITLSFMLFMIIISYMYAKIPPHKKGN